MPSVAEPDTAALWKAGPRGGLSPKGRNQLPHLIPAPQFRGEQILWGKVRDIYEKIQH